MRPVGTQIAIVSAALLVAAILLLGVNISQLRRSFVENRRSDQVLLQVAEAQTRLLGTEMSVRGYAMTGDPRFLDYHEREKRHLYRALDRLAELMASDPSQTARLGEAYLLVGKRQEMISYYAVPEHASEMGRAIVDPKFRDLMRKARKQLATLGGAEQSALDAKQTEMIADARRSFALAVGIVVLAFVTGALGIVLSQSGRSGDTRH